MKKKIRNVGVFILVLLAIIAISIDWPGLIYPQENPEYKYMGLFQFEGYDLENYEPFDMTHIPTDARGRM